MQANTLERIEPAGNEGSRQMPTQPVTREPWDFSSPEGDEILALLKPDDRTRTHWLVAGALVAGFGLGWTCGFGWFGLANISALTPIAQTETPSHRIAETRFGGKIDGVRKTTSTLGSRTPSGVTQIAAVGASVSAKPLAAAPDGTPLSAEQADMIATGSIAPKGPMLPAPETGPTTIEGWTVLDVRGGTVVLGGPEGVQMAKRGDTVPGIGRINSIVRWGNRWIVATASGLIATP